MSKKLATKRLTCVQRRKMASSENTTSQMLARLARDRDFKTRLRVANNPKIFKGTSEYMALYNWDYDILLALTGNPSTSSNALNILACNKEGEIQKRVMHHPNATIRTHKLLAKHMKWPELLELAISLDTPALMLQVLADRFPKEVACNLATSESTLRRLLKSRKLEVREAAKANLKLR